MTSPNSLRSIAFAMLIVVATRLAFAPVFRNEFLNWDDQETLSANRDFNPPTLDGVARYWSGPAGELYVPITYTVWGGLAGLAYSTAARGDGSHLNPAVFHGANLALHAAAAVVVFIILRNLVKSDPAACAGALLFALHPAQVEAVAWASGMKDVLCGLFSLIALDQFLRFIEPAPPHRDSHRRAHYAAGAAALALAMLAKPAAVAVPLSAAAAAVWALGRPWRQVAKTLLPWAAMAAPVMVVAKMVQDSPQVDSPWWARPVVAMDALAWYAYRVVVPAHFAVDYGWAPDWLIRRPWAYVIWVVPVGLAAVAWRSRDKAWVAAGLALTAAPLIPVLGLARFSFQYYSTVSDHYLYAAMLGPAMLLAFALTKIAPTRLRPQAAPALAFMVVTGLGIETFIECRRWRDTETLFTHTLEVNPSSLAAHRNLAFLLTSRGRFTEAVVQYEQALRTRPADPTTHYNLGNLLFLRRNDPAAAIPHYEAAVKGWPHDPRFHANLSYAYRAVGRNELARAEAVRTYVETGRLLLSRGDHRGAVEQFQHALDLSPTDNDAGNGRRAATENSDPGG